ncbi:PAS domain S-box protein [Sphingobacterium yanglingense]|uniref:histidine kinase n=1 Tax=Sphingobacterium yanglingense TaxID=1437280 RepID=A0A4R6WLY0_9SPHI|nr:PAS domain S-box protein [Sphingobacterium yanglingense]TDQ80017.1 PAS domain S-box-containing protein [Sphingobacterium yanglingense]
MENTNAMSNILAQLKLENNRLREKVDELGDCLENATVPIHWVDENGIITWANTAELETLGYSKEEYIGSSILDYHIDKNVIFDILVRLKCNETIRNYSADLRCKDGSTKHVLISTNALMRDGKFIHTRCFTRDVTDTVKEKNYKTNLLLRLDESETRLKLAVQSTKMGTWYWDTHSNDIYISNEGREILGLPAESIIEKTTFLQYILPNHQNVHNKHSIKILENGKEGHFDSTHKIHKIDDGTSRTLRVQGAIHTINGNLPRFIGTVLDITDIVTAHETDKRLAAIIRSSNDAIVGKTVDGIITSWNIAAERIFGYSEQEMIGTSIFKIVPEDKRQEEEHILFRLGRGETMEHFETKRLTKSGKLIDVSLTISPIQDMDGKILGISKIARDITEKRQEEKRKHDFVTMVSHEIKTPLTSILLYVQVLLKSFKAEENDNALNIGIKIEALTKKIIMMVKDYLSLSRVAEGKIDIYKEEFELSSFLQEIVVDTKFLTNKHDISIDGCDAIWVFADKSKLEQVFVNLLNNAIKYSPAGGDIVIECRSNTDKVTISIIDQGIGIREEDQKKLFKRFYRINRENTSTISGFGIGLYLVAEILKNHGSSIHVISHEGCGARFYFDLELKKTNVPDLT